MIGPATSELVDRIATCLRSEQQVRDADSLSRKRNAQRGKPTVLVAGEDKRGKSSLVNALIGRPELSPVGVEVVTGVPISFFYSEQESARVVGYGKEKATEVDFETARRLATVQGNPQNVENIRAVQLGIPTPLLKGVTIVDTPGVGGLESGHGELTLQSLQFADALVFVIEAGAQFRGAELAFLRRASARIDTVVLALTKIDLHRGWRTILQDNLSILQEQAPRFASCPVVPVSSVLAARATKCEDPEDAEMLREESGIPVLEETLTHHVLERANVLADANLLREATRPLAVAERAVWEQLSALTSDGKAREALQAEQKRLAKLGEDKADWPRKIDAGARDLGLKRQEDAARGLIKLRRRYDERLKNPSKLDVDSMPGELVADLTALAGTLNEDAAKYLTDLVEGLIDEIDESSNLRSAIEQATASRLGDELESIEIGSHGMTHYDKLSILSSISSGKSLSTLISGGGLGISAGALICPPVGIAIGLGLGAFYAFSSFKYKRRSYFASEFKTWMSEQCGQAQTTINTTFQRDMIKVQEEMRSAVRDALAERERQINASLDASKKMLASEESERTKAKEALQARLKGCRDLQRDVRGLLKQLSGPAGEEPAKAGASASV
jgi:hypothetical protein